MTNPENDATEIWNAIADGKKFSKGNRVIIHGFSWGLRVLVQETPVKKKMTGWK